MTLAGMKGAGKLGERLVEESAERDREDKASRRGVIPTSLRKYIRRGKGSYEGRT